ncbi:MAG: SDR family oxidoreductase [Xanthomonadales bacterium]|nr:SDR family oxidoreductase [Xanthomonadales bacterium]
MSLRAFVTGATGFVGQNLARQLVEQGWDVTALVRGSSLQEDIADLDLHLAEGDVTDAASVARAMPAGVDAVYHVAASTSVWSRNNTAQRRVNIEGTRNVLEASIANGAHRFIHTSTFAVWGFQPRRFDERTPRLANSDWINYVATKREAESLVHQAVESGRVDAVILNPAHILGPGDRHNWSRVIRLVHENTLPGVPPGGGSFADVREVARAHIQAFKQGGRGQNYLLGGPDTKFIDVVHMVGELLGRKVPAKATPAWMLKAAARAFALRAAITGREPDLTPEGAALVTNHIGCDSSRAERELGYRFTPVRKLLEDTRDWMRARDMLP